jgi:hypothetical protein
MLNIQGLMKQAQMMQKKMQETQTRLAAEEREGSAGNGLVRLTLNGRSEMKKISIDTSVVDPTDVETLEDLILAAYNDAHRQIDAMQEEGMKEATGGANFGGLKIPF